MFWPATQGAQRATDATGAALEGRADPPPRTSPEPLSMVPLELIEREIEALAAQINAGSARWLCLVAEFDRRQGWWDSGCRSISEWIAWRCALNPRSAREHVRVARALVDLPRIRAAFTAGALSYSKVRALTRVADPDSEAELVELARHATAAQLERMVRAARRVSAAEADEAHRRTFVRWSWDDEDGCLRLDAKLSAEDGALFLRALESARDALHEKWAASEKDADGSAGPLAAIGPGGSAEPPAPLAAHSEAPPPRPVPSPTNAESLVALSEAALARPPTGLAGGDRYQVLVHVDSETLATDEPGASVTGRGACAIADGPGISPETARRLACDASLVTISERRGEPVGVGRRRRSIPPSIRRALVARDGRCQFPGCERWRFVDAHHVRHWAHGGETGLDNLVLLCRHHHRLVHEGGFSVSLSPDGRRGFARPDGASIPASPPPPSVDPGELPATLVPTLTGSGEHMDLGSCVNAVLAARAGPRAPEGAAYAESWSSSASS